MFITADFAIAPGRGLDGENIPSSVPTPDTIDVDRGVIAFRITRALTAMLGEPGVVVATDVLSYPRCGGHEVVRDVARQINEDDRFGIFHCWLAGVRLPRRSSQTSGQDLNDSVVN